jgi:hypothetical protein
MATLSIGRRVVLSVQVEISLKTGGDPVTCDGLLPLPRLPDKETVMTVVYKNQIKIGRVVGVRFPGPHLPQIRLDLRIPTVMLIET